jgi:CheY-like chemotaxis protein
MSRTDPCPNHSLRVLVVDDDVDAAQSLCCLLESMGGTAAASHDGPDGLALASTFEPELAIIDLEMPGMEGREVMQHLRLQNAPSLALAVCLTGHDAPQASRLCIAAGFDAFMTKPLRHDALASLLDQTRVRTGASGGAPGESTRAHSSIGRS